MAFYLKHRPQTLDEVIGQVPVKEILSKAIQNGKLSHGYIFCGPKGSGKTSTARILAKMVNCEKGTPCNKCDTCLSITDGSNLDLIEIDAASNRGIDDVRALRENIKLAPSSSKKKVYIIDEAHMLTGEAFNALLKTLEEPPQHVLFILATTESGKIPQTILSRLQRLDFIRASEDDIRKVLEGIADKENLKVNKEALILLAKKSEGSFRDGVKMLEQVSAMGDNITAELIESSFRSGTFDGLCRIMEALSARDAAKAILELGKEIEKGTSIKELTSNMTALLRQMLFIKHELIKQVKEDIGSQKFEKIYKLSEQFNIDSLVQFLNLLQEVLEKIRFASIQSLPLEIAVVEGCMEQKLEARKEKLEINGQVLVEAKEQVAQHQEPAHIPVPTIQPEASNLSLLLDKWSYILETIKPYNFSLEALLRQAKIIECSNGKVVLEVPYSFHQRIIEAPKSKDILESSLSGVLGKAVSVSCVLGHRPIRDEEISNVEMAQDDDIINVASEIFNSEQVN